MITINPSRWKTAPFAHQVQGVRELIAHRNFALFDQMGSGKSHQIVNAACELHAARQLDAVLIIAPANVRSVWLDAKDGQIKRHSWRLSQVFEYHAKCQTVWSDDSNGVSPLLWVVTNYEYIVPEAKRKRLLNLLKDFMWMLVADESIYLKSHISQRYKALKELRTEASRCVILNGTPVGNSPLDLWAQLEVLDHRILGRHYANYYHFKASVCIMKSRRFGARQFKEVVGYREKEIERIQRIVAPHCLRRLKKDCLDLPDKVGGIESDMPVIREVALSAKTWKVSQELKRDCLLNLPPADVRLEPNAGVRIGKLAQLCGGFVSNPASARLLFDDPTASPYEDVSDEKLAWTVDYLKEWSTADATIVWCHFRRERERLTAMLAEQGIAVYQIYGGQPKAEQAVAKLAFGPSATLGRKVLCGQPRAGGLGLDLTAATEVIYFSNDEWLIARLQSEDRPHRPGQRKNVTYLDILATGPTGQKTMDHIIYRALREHQVLAAWTASAWRRALEEE